jgi:tRNA(adenine34) deaminase
MQMWTTFDAEMMSMAIEQAKLALTEGEVPAGAAISHGGRLIALGRNRREQQKNPIAHAEILAIREAARVMGDWRLSGCALYVTLEPCPMCAGAVINSRIEKLVFGARDPQMGCAGSIYRITEDPAFNHYCPAHGGLMAEECEEVLKLFFKKRRER